MTCVCGLGESLQQCCERYLSGKEQPPTAEALMRARYAAFATGQIDYIVDTHHPSNRHTVDRKGVEAWSRESEWLGLTIVATEKGGPQDSHGVVEFSARYREAGAVRNHCERSRFEKHEGRWYFVDGEAAPAVRNGEVGRNQPCPCGSGKKYKRCCG
jgi:SEC-C motif-containing protein